MYNIFETIKSIYKKTKLDTKEIESFHCIALNKWLSYDEDNTDTLKKAVKYFFYLSTEMYVKLLYLCIAKKSQAPFLHKVEKEKVKENLLYNKIRDTLQWTDRELKLHSKLLEKIIEPKYWKKQLGV